MELDQHELPAPTIEFYAGELIFKGGEGERTEVRREAADSEDLSHCCVSLRRVLLTGKWAKVGYPGPQHVEVLGLLD